MHTGDSSASPPPSEATGLLAPDVERAEPQHEPSVTSSRRSPSGWELALLGFAALVPVSVALAQVLLAVFVLAWFLGRGDAGVRRWPSIGLVVAISLIFVGEWLACAVNRVPGQLFEPIRRHAVLLALPMLAGVASVRPEFYRRVVGVAAAVAAIVAVYAVWQHFTGVDLVRGRVLGPRGDAYVATGTFSHHLTYGGSAMLAMAAACGLFLGDDRRRGLPAALTLPLGLGLLWSYARSSWIGAFAGLVVLGIAARRGRRTLALAALGLIAVAVVLAGDWTVRERIREGYRWETAPPRVLLLRTSLGMLRDHPLGIGPGRFEELFPIYKVPGRYLDTEYAHSDPLRAALDGGPLGLAGYAILVIGTLLAAATALRRIRPRAGEPAGPDWHAQAARRDLLLTALGASTALLVAGLFQTYFWNQACVMLWILLVAPVTPYLFGGRHADEETFPGSMSEHEPQLAASEAAKAPPERDG